MSRDASRVYLILICMYIFIRVASTAHGLNKTYSLKLALMFFFSIEGFNHIVNPVKFMILTDQSSREKARGIVIGIQGCDRTGLGGHIP